MADTGFAAKNSSMNRATCASHATFEFDAAVALADAAALAVVGELAAIAQARPSVSAVTARQREGRTRWGVGSMVGTHSCKRQRRVLYANAGGIREAAS